jgi:hypothetical protein
VILVPLYEPRNYCPTKKGGHKIIAPFSFSIFPADFRCFSRGSNTRTEDTLKKIGREYMDWIHLAQDISCEHCNGFSACIQLGEFLDQLSGCELLEKNLINVLRSS